MNQWAQMDTESDDHTLEASDDGSLDVIAERIRKGQVFIYPTDTCYGIGCTIKQPSAIERVFTIKGRSDSKPVPVLIKETDLEQYVDVTSIEQKAIDRHWPGGLTVVLSANNPDDLDDRLLSDGTMALREPDMSPVLKVLSRTGPIIGTSANPSGLPAPSAMDDIHPELFQTVDFVLGEQTGNGESSTVAQWEPTTQNWTIHREGPISRDQLPNPGESSNS